MSVRKETSNQNGEPVEDRIWSENLEVDDNIEREFEFPVNYDHDDDHDDDQAHEPADFPSQEHELEPQSFSGTQDIANLLVPTPKQTNAEDLTFAKKAKRVDVAKLKENIWTEFKTKNEPQAQFTELVTNLDHVYPEKERSDISVAFCFICVLHLANENNLKISGNNQMNELLIHT